MELTVADFLSETNVLTWYPTLKEWFTSLSSEVKWKIVLMNVIVLPIVCCVLGFVHLMNFAATKDVKDKVLVAIIPIFICISLHVCVGIGFKLLGKFYSYFGRICAIACALAITMYLGTYWLFMAKKNTNPTLQASINMSVWQCIINVFVWGMYRLTHVKM